MKKTRLILPIILSTACLSGCDWFNKNTEEAFYRGYDLTLEGDRLVMELQRQAFDKHTQWILYSQVNSYYSRKTDENGNLLTNSIEAVANDSRVNEWYYTGKQAGGSGTREHVWPCANSAGLWDHKKNAGQHYVDGTGYFGGGSDLLHIRSCNTTINTARGNSKFVDFDDPEMESLRDGVVEITEPSGKYKLKIQGATPKTVVSQGKETVVYEYAEKSEPADQMKGDVARLILYVWMHYADRGNAPDGNATAHSGSKTYTQSYSNMVGGLDLTNIMGYTTYERCVEKLIEWNELDKPSEVEKLRNDTVQKIQGNRNPFVDKPELVAQMFE